MKPRDGVVKKSDVSSTLVITGVVVVVILVFFGVLVGQHVWDGESSRDQRYADGSGAATRQAKNAITAARVDSARLAARCKAREWRVC